MDEKISTGSFDLNKWLFGGYEKGIITMIVGPPGSGKSNFSILASCSVARNNKVIFIDTEGGFSIDRVKQIVGEKNSESILENIFILNPTNFLEQKNDFKKLLGYVKNDKIGLIVIDSIAMLYRLELANAKFNEEKVKKINYEMSKQMRDLVEISRKQNMPILITNQVYHNFLSSENLKNKIEPEINIVGGDLFKYWSKCVIELKQVGKIRKAVLLKHRNLPQSEINFEIKNEGIFEKKGFFN